MRWDFFIIDKLSIVSKKLMIDIHSRFRKIFVILPEKTFAGKSVIILPNYFQLPPVSQ